MTVLFIQCSSSSAAQQIVTDVEAGELWGVDMGSTSKVTSYSNCALIECTLTRHLNLFDAEKDLNKYSITYATTDPDSFTDAPADWKVWFLRGRL
tara:strand:- start:13219 stop:13503 length:285 start_codon:yes stop_codon:yes gene_type:complete